VREGAFQALLGDQKATDWDKGHGKPDTQSNAANPWNSAAAGIAFQ
jgi:hypothetical protein